MPPDPPVPREQLPFRRLDVAEQLECIITTLARVEGKIDKLMSTAANSAAALQAGEALIETDIGKLGTAMSTGFADLKAEVAAKLNAGGVDPTLVDSVTASIAALDTKVQGLTAQATAADPGPQPAAPTQS